MTEAAKTQIGFASQLAELISEHFEDVYSTLDLLDDLGCAGMKLSGLNREDFCNTGESIVTKAYAELLKVER